VTNSGAITAPSNTEAQGTLEYRVTQNAGTPSAWSTSYTAPATDGSADGSYVVELRQTDLAGNPSAIQSVAFVLDTQAPSFSSAATASINENLVSNSLVYTAAATDAGSAIAYSLKTGEDSAKFSINASTGQVRLQESPNAEVQASYSFTVVATDRAGQATERAVTLSVNDLNDLPPVFTSAATASVEENQAASTVVYTAVTTDADLTVANRAVSYSLKSGLSDDMSLLNIDAATGAVTLKASANFEAKASYSFTVVATNTNAATGVSLSAQQAVTLSVTDLNEAPVRTGTLSSIAVNEDSAPSGASLGLTGISYAGGAGEEASQTLSYAITAIPSFVTLTKADGTAVDTTTTGLTQADMQGLRYKTVGQAKIEPRG
jgi:hypothetical protein